MSHEREAAKVERDVAASYTRPTGFFTTIWWRVGNWTLMGMFLFFICAAPLFIIAGAVAGYLLAQK